MAGNAYLLATRLSLNFVQRSRESTALAVGNSIVYPTASHRLALCELSTVCAPISPAGGGRAVHFFKEPARGLFEGPGATQGVFNFPCHVRQGTQRVPAVRNSAQRQKKQANSHGGVDMQNHHFLTFDLARGIRVQWYVNVVYHPYLLRQHISLVMLECPPSSTLELDLVLRTLQTTKTPPNQAIKKPCVLSYYTPETFTYDRAVSMVDTVGDAGQPGVVCHVVSKLPMQTSLGSDTQVFIYCRLPFQLFAEGIR